MNGGTTEDAHWPTEQVTRALGAAVSELARLPGPTIVSGGTRAGLFSLLGVAVDETGFLGPVVGVVPAGRINRAGDGGPGTALEPHHTHAVVVDAGSWGEETPTMLGLCHALGRRGSIVVLVAGGGAVTEREVQGHLAAGRPVVVLRGTGRVADDVAGRSPLPDGVLVVDVADVPELVAVLRRLLAPTAVANHRRES